MDGKGCRFSGWFERLKVEPGNGSGSLIVAGFFVAPLLVVELVLALLVVIVALVLVMVMVMALEEMLGRDNDYNPLLYPFAKPFAGHQLLLLFARSTRDRPNLQSTD